MRKIAYMGRRSNPDPYITSQLHWASHRPNSTPLLSLLKARITLRIADRIGITDRDSDLDSLFTLRIQFAIYAFTHLLCMTMFNLQNYNFNRYIKKKKLCACLLFLINGWRRIVWAEKVSFLNEYQEEKKKIYIETFFCIGRP